MSKGEREHHVPCTLPYPAVPPRVGTSLGFVSLKWI